MTSKWLKLAVPLVAVAFVASACGKEATDTVARSSATSTQAPPSTQKVQASDLRAGLTGLLSEHVYLASEATGAALRGDTSAFNAYASALNGPSKSNTSDLVAAISGVYGDTVGKAFDGLWRSN